LTYTLQGMSLDRQKQRVLHDLNLSFERGNVTGLIGPNGAGKSSLISVMVGQLQASSGDARLDGQSLAAFDPHRLARARAIMAQQIPSDIHLTVAQVMALGLYAFDELTPHQRNELVAQAADLVNVSAWLPNVMLTHSVGQQQRVHFARALVQVLAITRQTTPPSPGWLLLDEPTASQDPAHQQRLLACCRQLVAEKNIGVIVALHDLTLAAQWCDKLVVLREGGVVASGHTREILTERTIQQAFGSDLQAHVLQTPAPGVVIFKKTNDNKSHSLTLE